MSEASSPRSIGERPGEIDKDFRGSCKRGKASGERFAVEPNAARFGEEMRDGFVELTPRDGLGSAAVPQRVDFFPNETESIDRSRRAASHLQGAFRTNPGRRWRAR